MEELCTKNLESLGSSTRLAPGDARSPGESIPADLWLGGPDRRFFVRTSLRPVRPYRHRDSVTHALPPVSVAASRNATELGYPPRKCR
jgi:hypothetical protein